MDDTSDRWHCPRCRRRSAGPVLCMNVDSGHTIVAIVACPWCTWTERRHYPAQNSGAGHPERSNEVVRDGR